MMSLLNLLQSEDPAVQNGLLNFGLSLMRSKGNFGNAVGQAGVAGQLGARDYRQQQALMSRTSLNDELLRMRVEDEKRQATQQAQMQALAQKYQRTPQQNAMAQNGGPTVAAANAIPNTPGGFDYQGYANELPTVAGPMAALNMQQLLQKQGPKLESVPADSELGYLGSDGNWVSVVKGKPKEEAQDQLTKLIKARDALPLGDPNRTVYDARIKTLTSHAPAPVNNVSVNTGQKGLDNTLKLRADFRSEPIYKAHQEMQAAYSQIQQSLKQASPAGDLAGATKIMKLLDPGSVVRESELGMAMAASGLLDRMQNYANMVINGTKLTPTQRKDFQTLADALYGESVKQYNAKRAEYQGIAERNGLPVQDVLGSESKAPEKAGEWSITRVP